MPIGVLADQVKSRILLSAVIGRDVKLTKQGPEHMGICPFHNERTGSFTVNDAKGFAHCFGCGWHGDLFEYLNKQHGLEFMAALRRLQADAGIDFGTAKHRADMQDDWIRQREARERDALEDREKRRRNAAGIWQGAVPMLATPAQDYLAGERRIDFARIGRLPGAVRYMPDCWHDDVKRKMPAMVMAMHGLDGAHLATHITYLTKTGSDWCKVSRRAMKDKIIRGSYGGGHMSINKGACRKPLRDFSGDHLFIGESNEDCFTVAMSIPHERILGAAALGNIGKIDLPPQVKRVTLIAQNDPEGGGADILFEKEIGKLQARGLAVDCMWPKPMFKDFNDQMRNRAIVSK